MPDVEYDATYFPYFRRHDGSLEAKHFAKQNGRRVPLFPRDVTQPEELRHTEPSDEYLELEDELTCNLTNVERRRLLRLADGIPILELAREEKVSRQAIKTSIRQMIRKNEYCAISSIYGVLRNKANQHK